MERLTARIDSGCLKSVAVIPNFYIENTGFTEINDETLKNVTEKLAHYEDLAEQGRLVVLPCKVGDTVYAVRLTTPKYDEYTVTGFSIKESGLHIDMGAYWVKADDLGKESLIFLDKAEAEKALAERG